MTNALLVTVDSLRGGYVFGGKAPDDLETLPALGERALRCTTAFSNATSTRESCLSILSGSYPWLFDTGGGGFEADRPHLGTLLSDAGYATGGFLTLPAPELTDRFDYSFRRDRLEDDGLLGGSVRGLVDRMPGTDAVSSVLDWMSRIVGSTVGIQLGSSPYTPAADLSDALVDWVQDTTPPWFAWVHYMDVHTPYYPHEGTISEDLSRRRAVKLYHRANKPDTDLQSEDVDTLERLYRGEVSFLDDHLGTLFDRLDEEGVLADTTVVVGADHGEAFDEHGFLFHPANELYDEVVHVPLLVSGPGIEPADLEVPVSNVDILPTVLSSLGIDPPQATSGAELQQFVTDPPEDRLVFAEAEGPTDGSVMVTDGRNKLIRNLASGEEVLYDRKLYPKERRDMSAERPEEYADLRSALENHLDTVRQRDDDRADLTLTEDGQLRPEQKGYDE